MERNVRLACMECYRDDMDGITRGELLQAIKGGWKCVSRFQSYEDSIKTYDDPKDEPPGYSVLDWYTHLGWCPECCTMGRGPD